jgi:hypothetical protein
MKEFVTVAGPDFGKVDKSKQIQVKHDGKVVTFYQPEPGQAAVMLTMMGEPEELEPEQVATFIELFFSLMDKETARHFRTRLMDRNDPFEFDVEGGVVDLFVYVSEQWAPSRPSKKPSDFQPPQRVTGKSSTAASRVKASTSSPSRSRASSR